mgnify:CR=1 FL=1
MRNKLKCLLLEVFFDISTDSVSCSYFLPIDNIALNKPASQQYPYSGNVGDEHLIQAGNAVDGLKLNLSVWAGQCAISDENKRTATLRVNLESISSIHHIAIYYRTENIDWGMYTRHV